MSAHVLHISNVSMHYGKHKALDQVSIDIQPGVFGLLGPNGAGKTTLMRIITTLLMATEGELRYGDISWKQPQHVREMIGYLPQKFSLYKHIRVHEALNHIAILKGIRTNRKERIETVMRQVNLSEHQHKKIGQLSGGMVRRVGIAQAILGDPKIIVVDEPTAGLDPEERIRFRNVLRSLGKQSTVIISTHIVEDIESVCERAAIMYNGQVLIHDDVRAIGEIAAGHVWRVSVRPEDMGQYEISEQWKIVSSERSGAHYHLRILTDQPPDGAERVTPTLEDGYLYAMEQSNAR